jgi:hypothetical protein
LRQWTNPLSRQAEGSDKPSLSLRRAVQSSGSVDCMLYEVDRLYPPDSVPPDGGDSTWVCIEDEGDRYYVDLPGSYLKQMGASSGNTRMRHPDAMRSPGTAIEPPKLVFSSKTVPEFISENNGGRRKLLASMGTFSTLVVRVTSSDMAPSRSASTISSDVFSDSINFAGLMSDCSANKAKFVPATGANIVGGVAEVTISMNTRGVVSGTVETAAMNAVRAKFSAAVLDNIQAIILILPFNGMCQVALVLDVLTMYFYHFSQFWYRCSLRLH